ncbi:VanZ family protein [Streptomyces sp. ISID311]|uniref:VanZ family protein n=1 Tax=Streptomyces sp. ISID311 TaxID=2601673 RepID=UPI0011BD353C|nr:VanZ family protein [Streptomyces sp. ISID311]TXC94249.1 VanZ family protein [Streptomyces sp. ISID311]
MLEAVFKGHAAFTITAIAISVAFFIMVFLASKKRTDRPVSLALWCTSMVSVLFLTLWANGGTQGAGTCVANLSLLEPFGTEQGLLNCLMFTPVGFMGVIVTRRVVPAFACGVALSALIETAQGALPAIGRACDTSDLVSNSVGSMLGAFIGFALVRFQKSDLTPWRMRRSPAVITCTAFSVLLGTVWITSIQTHSVRATEAVGSAAGDQRHAAVDAVHQAFGDHYAVGNVQFSSSLDSDRGTVMASLPVGFVQVNWPEANEITASLDMSDSGKPSGFPVPGAPAHVGNSTQAKKAATTYAQTHFSWALPGSKTEVSPVGKKASLGWLVSWRRYHNSVLMPMRLDVQIDRTGHVSQLSTRKVPDVATPPSRIKKDEALRIAKSSSPGCQKAEAGELLAVQNRPKWHAVWRIKITCKDSSAIVHINARSGAVEMTEKHPNRA